jgi:hypothetical protein
VIDLLCPRFRARTILEIGEITDRAAANYGTEVGEESVPGSS